MNSNITFINNYLRSLEALLGVSFMDTALVVNTFNGDHSHLGPVEYTFTFQLSPSIAKKLTSALPFVFTTLSMSLVDSVVPFAARLNSSENIRNCFSIGFYA